MTMERRSKARQPIHRDALLCAADGKPITGCHLCDVSAEGARLSLAAPELAKLPDEFILVLAKRAKVHRRCRVVWRTEDEVGVRFSA
jgi:PilZ domain